MVCLKLPGGDGYHLIGSELRIEKSDHRRVEPHRPLATIGLFHDQKSRAMFARKGRVTHKRPTSRSSRPTVYKGRHRVI